MGRRLATGAVKRRWLAITPVAALAWCGCLPVGTASDPGFTSDGVYPVGAYIVNVNGAATSLLGVYQAAAGEMGAASGLPVAVVANGNVSAANTINVWIGECAAAYALACTGRSLSGQRITGATTYITVYALLSAPNWDAVIRHELGHAFGLGHYDVSPQVMSSKGAQFQFHAYNWGDRAGLASQAAAGRALQS